MSDSTYFDRLGLPRRFDLDAAAIERAYLEHSRALHPDFHHQGSDAEQRVSLEMTALLNQAYATLKHPFKRAEYLLGLEGGPSASEYKQMSPEFLNETLELRFRIQELRAEGPASPGLAKLEADLTARRESLIAALRRDFAELDGLPEGDGKRPDVRVRIRQTLNAAKYVENLLRDLRAD